MMLKTYNEIVNVVNEDNIDKFLADFEIVLRSDMNLKKALGNDLICEGFEWLDDDKPEMIIEIIGEGKANVEDIFKTSNIAQSPTRI
jgi:hypothetical protein